MSTQKDKTKVTKKGAILFIIFAFLWLGYGIQDYLSMEKETSGQFGMAIGGLIGKAFMSAGCLYCGVSFWRKAKSGDNNKDE